MKLINVLLGALALVFLSLAPASAQDAARPEAMIGFFTGQSSGAVGKLHNRGNGQEFYARAEGGSVKAMIHTEVCSRIGCQWSSTAMRIAHIESRFRCNARNGRAVGIFQNTNPAMFGISRAAALTCSGGIRAGVAHMAMCVGKGARTGPQMMRCHNSGSPWGRVERAYRVALAGG